VNKPLSWLRAWFVPIGLVLLAGLLTVPWSYLVLRAAYDRDVTEMRVSSPIAWKSSGR
jgi:hypothetical protein